MRLANIIIATLILAIGLALAIESWLLGAGWGRAGPMTGFFPFWLGVLLSLTAAALIAQAVLARSDGRPFLERAQLARVANVALPAVGAVVLIHLIGLYMGAALYLIGCMKMLGRHSWPTVLAIGFGTPLLAFLVFEIWFLTPMPKGPIEIWLGF